MSQKIATREAYGKALVELGGLNPQVVVLDADLSKSTKTADFAKHYPERFFNMGIAEQNMIGVAAGLAAAGKIPFASTFAMFATGRAFEQIRNSVAYPHLNVKIAASHAGITVGEDGGSHQTVEDIALMRSQPGLTVLVPADGPSTRAAVFAAAEIKGPVYLRLGRSGVPIIYDEPVPFTVGRANWLRRGEKAAIIACGIMVSMALEAAGQLAGEGIEVSVLDMHTIKPLDEAAVLEAARSCGALVVAEEHSIIGGLGSAVCEAVAGGCPVPVRRVGLPDVFGESGQPAELLAKYGLTVEGLITAVKAVLGRVK
ncbi:transketolase family protein [Desulfurispora thermophila]|uniref:transketolase family protein n=1 Tax=Desulfurispora thermophila TaxID=265470 RepID=UPI00037220EB|nr:transketolase family protein [Desulfurispora thermophila]